MTRSPNPRHQLFGLLSLVVAIAASTGCQKAHSTPPPGQAPTVGIVTIGPEPITLSTQLPGRTTSHMVAEIRPQVSGLILKRAFTEGASVRAGELLYQIDPAPYQAVYDQAAAALAVAEAQLPALRSRAERLGKLAALDAVGAQDAEDAAAALRQAEANVLVATAAMESARINLSYTPLQAPITGRIGPSNVTVGALVTAMQPTPLAVIQQLDPIYVDVVQSSAELLALRRRLSAGELERDGASGREVQLLLEDDSPYPFTGRLEFQDVTVDPSTGSVTLRMLFPNPEHLLLPGMFVRAVLEEGVQPQAILAPQQAVARDMRGQAVAWVVNEQELVEARQLELGRAIGDRWLVLSGLAAGDRLVVDGRQRVRPGVPVTAVPFEAAVESAQPVAANQAPAATE